MLPFKEKQPEKCNVFKNNLLKIAIIIMLFLMFLIPVTLGIADPSSPPPPPPWD